MHFNLIQFPTIRKDSIEGSPFEESKRERSTRLKKMNLLSTILSVEKFKNSPRNQPANNSSRATSVDDDLSTQKSSPEYFAKGARSIGTLNYLKDERHTTNSFGSLAQKNSPEYLVKSPRSVGTLNYLKEERYTTNSFGSLSLANSEVFKEKTKTPVKPVNTPTSKVNKCRTKFISLAKMESPRNSGLNTPTSSIWDSKIEFILNSATSEDKKQFSSPKSPKVGFNRYEHSYSSFYTAREANTQYTLQ